MPHQTARKTSFCMIMKKSKIPTEILRKVEQITGKRSRIVVEHILKHGSVTTEDINGYGYEHPPRAIRDVKEQGLPLERFWTKSKDGKKIAGYRFGNLDDIRYDRAGGRKVFPKAFQNQVIEKHRGICAICNAKFEKRYFQIDHRIPYEVAGDKDTSRYVAKDFMPLCGSCNRAKSWSCEHCINWQNDKNIVICRNCYWSNPAKYNHIAMREMRRLDITWIENEVVDYKLISNSAKKEGEKMPDYVKNVLRKHIMSKNDQ
ncbi:HNH endonuclease [Planctomycetota bacterium]